MQMYCYLPWNMFTTDEIKIMNIILQAGGNQVI